MKIYNQIPVSHNDQFGHDLIYYQKLFPVGEPFIYRSKYGGETILITHQIISINNLDLNLKSYKIRVKVIGTESYFNSYDVDYCDRTQFLRELKLKRVLKKKLNKND